MKDDDRRAFQDAPERQCQRPLGHAIATLNVQQTLEDLERRAMDSIFKSTIWMSVATVEEKRAKHVPNTDDSVSQLIKSGRVFVVERDGATLCPAYAVDAQGNPVQAVAEIIRVFDGYRPIRIAAWFESTNSLLHGRRPRELLVSDPAAVVAAAKDHVVGPTHG
jgi:hypothetical protein